MYRVIKVLNNNGILVLDDANGQEQILLGNGVGFGHRMGERMTELPKGRRYELVSEKTPALIRVNGIDPLYIEAAGKIIEMAEAAMGPLQHDILIPMADHIAMAAARAREKKEIPNPFQHDIAALFEGVAAIEKEHEERYRKLLANIEGDLVFSKDGDVIWQCSNCGHICVGKKAPEVCPVCNHPQAYFQVKAENY